MKTSPKRVCRCSLDWNDADQYADGLEPPTEDSSHREDEVEPTPGPQDSEDKEGGEPISVEAEASETHKNTDPESSATNSTDVEDNAQLDDQKTTDINDGGKDTELNEEPAALEVAQAAEPLEGTSPVSLSLECFC